MDSNSVNSGSDDRLYCRLWRASGAHPGKRRSHKHNGKQRRQHHRCFWQYVTDSTSASSEGDSVPDNSGTTGSNNNGTTTTTTTNGGSTVAPPKDVETKGKTFTIISTYLSSKRTNNMDLYAELFLERVQEVEKELECKINIVNSVYPTPEWLAPQIRAGKKVADLLHVEATAGSFCFGRLRESVERYPWSECKGFQFQSGNHPGVYHRRKDLCAEYAEAGRGALLRDNQ